MNISAFLLKSAGWKTIYSIEEPDKSIICVAPHTSNWDFIIGLLAYRSIKKRSGFLMKKSWFFFPMSLIFKALDGVPIDRSKKTSVTEQMVEMFNKKKKMALAITPEGTRKPVEKWKMGFYYIALNAGVPIQLAYIDYAKKEVGIKETLIPTGDVNEDLKKIYTYYKDVAAKKPENFILPIEK